MILLVFNRTGTDVILRVEYFDAASFSIYASPAFLLCFVQTRPTANPVVYGYPDRITLA